MSDKVAYTPVEFAALYSREKSWTYRQLYAGNIDAISDCGRIMIPASQIARIEGHAGRYTRKQRQRPQTETSQKVSSVANSAPANLRQSLWAEWLENRKNRPFKLKGMA